MWLLDVLREWKHGTIAVVGRKNFSGPSAITWTGMHKLDRSVNVERQARQLRNCPAV